MLRSEGETDGHGEQDVDQFFRSLDGRAKAHDGKRAQKAQGEWDGGLHHGQDHDRAERDQRKQVPERGAIARRRAEPDEEPADGESQEPSDDQVDGESQDTGAFPAGERPERARTVRDDDGVAPDRLQAIRPELSRPSAERAGLEGEGDLPARPCR